VALHFETEYMAAPKIRGTRSLATAEIARVGGHYAVQGHSRSITLLPVESTYATLVFVFG